MGVPRPLRLLPERLAICRLPADAPLPPWADASPAAPGRGFFSITRTEDELSLVVPEETVPRDAPAERGWRALRIEGTLDFALTGVLASLLVPLADAGVPIFALSTHDTDYVLLREQHLTSALAALTRAGHRIAGAERG